MQASVNRVVLLGTIGKYGVEMTNTDKGTVCARFSLVITESGSDGKEYSTIVPCEIWGKQAGAAGECGAGQLVAFEGKLRKKQKQDQSWEMIVSGFGLMPIATHVTT